MFVAAPLILSFGAVFTVITLGYQKLQLTQAAFSLAELASLADVSLADFEQLAEQRLSAWELGDAGVSLSKSEGVAEVRLATRGIAGLELEATGFAAIES